MAVRAARLAAQDGPQVARGAPREQGSGDVPEMESLVGLARSIQALFIEHGSTLATAESCTGGLVSHVLTEVSGSSAYYLGGIVAYSDPLKRKLLDVPEKTLTSHGAVSAQTAVAMAEGARSRLGADVAVSVTGIAGPTGDTPGKPVGLTYVAVADVGGHDVRRYTWGADRSGNKLLSAEAALELVLERVDAGGASGSGASGGSGE
jgi:nicotinamide-nucleotide amidase